MLDKTQAPVSKDGWELVQHFYDNRAQIVLDTGKSLQYLNLLVSKWQSSELYPITDFEVFIRPVRGWESVKGDPILAIMHLVSERLLTPGMGARQIREMVEKGETDDSL